jgi:hypothetical protein
MSTDTKIKIEKRSKQIESLAGWRRVYWDMLRIGFFGRTISEVYKYPFRTAIAVLSLNEIMSE